MAKEKISFRTILYNYLQDLNLEELKEFSNLDLVNFSPYKKLYYFQKEALEFLLKGLFLYFNKFKEDKDTFYYEIYEKYLTEEEKKELQKRFDFSKANSKEKAKIKEIVKEFYNKEKLEIKELMNRFSFWMATGSGKTLIIIKLIEILYYLMKEDIIPKRDIIFLTASDTLLKQFEKAVNEFNELFYKRGFKIKLKSLKDYKKIDLDSFIKNKDEIIVYFYKSYLIDEETKEKKINFRDLLKYDKLNGETYGDFYLILDEAHKGEKDSSLKQMYFNILSKKGFMFNFSATFTDPLDIITTIYNFNLRRFIKEGFGKHILLSEKSINNFKKSDEEEKVKSVLKGLIILSVLRKYYRELKEKAKKTNINQFYHSPLMTIFVYDINKNNNKNVDPDLILFLQTITKIISGELKDNLETILEKVKKELSEELKSNYLYEEELNINKLPEEFLEDIKRIQVKDILKYVFNTENFGDYEVILPKFKKEFVLELKNSSKPFLLVKIGENVENWFKKNNLHYLLEKINEKEWEDSFFESLDRKEEISILVGSRTFYEGWDSNRPNVIFFITIGGGKEAKKFVLQSVGRGVRIEPLPNIRRRSEKIVNAKENINIKVKELINNNLRKIIPLETLFVFGTKKKVLEEIFSYLKSEDDNYRTLELKINPEIKNKLLLKPTFKEGKPLYELIEEGKPLYKLKVSNKEKIILKFLQKKFKNSDDFLKVLLIEFEAKPEVIESFKNFEEKNLDELFAIQDKNKENDVVSLKDLLSKFFSHLQLKLKEFSDFKELESEDIIHFKRILVSKDKISKIEKEIKEMLNNRITQRIEEIKEKINKYKDDPIIVDSLRLQINNLTNRKLDDISIKYIKNHYYIPILLSEDEKIDWIKHIIKTKSESNFIDSLVKNFIEKDDEETKRIKEKIDYWLFSKIDEHLDKIYIPYIEDGKLKNFKPDFIFWIKYKDNRYRIVFVDPKGVSISYYQNKIDAFEKYFIEKIENNRLIPKKFKFNELEIEVLLYLYNESKDLVGKKYRPYWINSKEIKQIFL